MVPLIHSTTWLFYSLFYECNKKSTYSFFPDNFSILTLQITNIQSLFKPAVAEQIIQRIYALEANKPLQ
ncbi:MAG: hypothetical protein C4329_01410 [Chitinophagaceae bacterium]